MKNWTNNNMDYYGSGSKYGNSTTKSVHEKKQNLSISKVNEGKSKFDTRIEKACPTNSIQAYKKEVYILKKELERIEKENLKKDNRMFQMQNSFNVVKQLESELQETYRIIYLYEGKIQELQKELKRLQYKIADHLETSISPTDIESLLSEYRNDNTEMRGTLQSQNRIIMELQERLRTVESKYFQTQWKLSTQNRIIQNPLKKKFPKLRDIIVIQEMSLAQRQKMMNEMQNKFQEINKETSTQNQQNLRNLNKNTSNSNEKYSIRLKDPQEVQNKKFVDSRETPQSAKVTSFYTPKVQVSQNYTMGKVKSKQKINTVQYAQSWQQNKREGKNVSYDFYRNNENRKNSNGGSQSQNASLNYSLSDGPLISQGTKISQNGVLSQYFGAGQSKYISSQSNDNIQNRSGSNVKILSLSNANSTSTSSPYNNYEPYSKSSNTQRVEPSYSPSSKIIRISRQRPKEQAYQIEKQSYQTYGSGQQTPTSKNVKYITRPY